MDDLKEIADRVFATPGRAKGGVCGQTIDAMQRSTFHQISAYDTEALYEAAAEITRLRAALDHARNEAESWRDAYTGAMEDKRMWKRRAQKAEAERDEMERKKNLNWLAAVEAKAERDAAWNKALDRVLTALEFSLHPGAKHAIRAMKRAQEVPTRPSMSDTMSDEDWHSDDPDNWNINAGKENKT